MIGATVLLLLAPAIHAAQISGEVLRSDGGFITEASVRVFDETGNTVQTTQVDASGQYLIDGLAAGNYRIMVSPTPGGADSQYVTRVHAGRDCNLFCDDTDGVIDGDVVALTAAEARTIDFTLQLGGSITGTVTEELSGDPIEGLGWVFGPSGKGIGRNLAADGSYTREPLLPGDYWVHFEARGASSDFVDELYLDVACPFRRCDFEALGTPVTVSAGGTVTVDGELAQGNTIQGTVTAPDDSPVVGGVTLWQPDGSTVATEIETDGGYSFGGLVDGDYKLLFEATGASSNLVDELHDNVPCPGGSCDFGTQGDFLSLTGNSVSTVDAVLEPGATIQGQVVSALDGTTPIEGRVEILQITPNSTEFVGNSAIEPDGSYSIGGLPPGDYKVWFNAGGADENFIDELHEDVNCPQLACDERSLGTTIALTAGATRTVSAQLTPGAEFTGTLTRADGGAITEAWVEAYDDVGNFVGSTQPDSAGQYVLPGLVAGDYTLRVRTFGADKAYIGELHEDITCLNFCNPVDGKVETLAAGETRTIDFELQRGYQIIANLFDDADASVPVTEACFRIRDGSGDWLTSFCDNASDGVFASMGLPAGDYKLEIDPYGGSERYLDELYDDVSCFGGCDPRSEGAAIALVDSNVTLDIGLARANLVSGRITDATTGEPIVRDLEIQIRSTGGTYFSSDFLFDADGRYAVAVPDGEYVIDFRPYGDSALYVREIHADFPCPLGRCDLQSAPTVTLSGADVTVDEDLELGGSITAVVEANTAGQPRVTDGVLWLDAASGLFDFRPAYSLSNNGEVSIKGLPAGEDYYLTAESGQSAPVLVDELFENVPCPGADCDPVAAGGTAVQVTPGANTDVGFVLDPAPTRNVSGRVTDATTGAALEGVTVEIYRAFEATPVATTSTDASGAYSFADIQEGEVSLIFEKNGYITRDAGNTRFADNGWCPARSCFDFPGPRRTVQGGDLTGVDVGMDPGAEISGTLTLPGGAPATAATETRLRVFSETGQETFDLRIRPINVRNDTGTGLYRAELPPGRWYLLFSSWNRDLALIDTAYGGVRCPNGACVMTATTPVEVAQGDSVAGIDGQYEQGVPITGSLVDEDQSVPLRFEYAWIYDTAGQLVSYGFSDNTGTFVTGTGLPDGTYFASTIRQVSPTGGFSFLDDAFVDELYDDIPCLAGCDMTAGTPIEIVGQQLPDPITIALARGASISGSIAGPAGPLEFNRVEVYDAAGDRAGDGFSDADGNYSVQGLIAGTYFARTDNFMNLENELFDDILCEPFCDPTVGDPIPVPALGEATGIDFALNGAASLAGDVRDPAGDPAEGVVVEVYDALGSRVSTAVSAADGTWLASSLGAGDHFVRTRNAVGLVDTAYDGVVCSPCDVTDTTALSLTRGENRTGVFLELLESGRIEGTVRSSAGPVAGVDVRVFDPSGELVVSDTTASDGTWGTEGLPSGTYHVSTRSSLGLVDEAFGDVVCEPDCSPTAGTGVSVSAGGVAQADFVLEEAGRVLGTVRSASGTPLTGIAVQAHDSSGALLGSAESAADGGYVIPGLAAGDVFLRTDSDSAYTDQTYSGFDCLPSCDVLNGTPVTVASGADASGIDFSLTRGAGLAGSVADATGSALGGISIEVFDLLGGVAATAATDGSGAFEVRGLADGRYFLRTRNSRGLIDEVWDGFGCTPGPCVPVVGTPVDVENTVTGGIAIELAEGGEINGTATDQFANPLPFGEVVLFDLAGSEVKRAPIVGGNWTLDGVADGDYLVVIRNGSGLIDELFDNVPCPGGRCDFSQGTVVTVGGTPSAPVSGRAAVRADAGSSLSFELEPGSRIAGRVIDAGGVPVAGATVFFFNAEGAEIGSAVTDAAGEYESEAAFNAGDYFVATANGERRGVGDGRVNRVYDGGDCPLDCDVTAGQPVALDAQSDATGIDLVVRSGGALSGRATSDYGMPLAGAIVEAYDAAGNLAGRADVDSLGDWRIDGLPAGDYVLLVRTDLLRAFTDFVAGAGRCTDDCVPLAGDPVALGPGGESAGIDIRLIPEAFLFRSDFER